MKLGLKCCFNRLLVVKLGVSLWLLLLMDISLRFSQSPTSTFSQSAWGGLFIVFHGTTRYYKYLDTIDLDQYLDYMGGIVYIDKFKSKKR
jgi:hypothetical protein